MSKEEEESYTSDRLFLKRALIKRVAMWETRRTRLFVWVASFLFSDGSDVMVRVMGR